MCTVNRPFDTFYCTGKHFISILSKFLLPKLHSTQIQMLSFQRCPSVCNDADTTLNPAARKASCSAKHHFVVR